jgi:hypothetical protein
VLALPNGIPSRDCIRRVLTALKPEAFQACFTSWIASLANEDACTQPIIAIDGKTMRRQGQRTLNSFRRKDFHQELVAPSGDLALSLDAVL